MENIEIMMFCQGDDIEFQGYKCSFVNISILDKPQYELEGYVDHPKELYEEAEETDDDIRAKAKAAGISKWHVKSIDTLKNELADD